MVTQQTAYKPSKRIMALRQRVMSQHPELFFGWSRTYLYMKGWEAAAAHSLPLRNGLALCHIIENMPLVVHDGEILVGEHGNVAGDWRQICNFYRKLPEDTYTAIRDSNLLESEQTELVDWLKSKPFSFMSMAPVAGYPDELVKGCEAGVLMGFGTDLNHSIRGYEKVLQLGFSGLAEEVERQIATLQPTDPELPTKLNCLQAFNHICASAMQLGNRYADLAREKAMLASSSEQQAEWAEIAEVCERVPAYPARTFREAVQALWFAHMITIWEDGVNANGIGRLDQFLYPYYQNDIEMGVMSRDEAAEILAALWVKLYQAYDVQQMMLGGQLSDGTDAVNELSYLALDVTEGLDFTRCLSARLHRGSPPEFVARCVDLLAKGGGVPFFFNDEVLIPALTAKGISLEDARGYAAIGCVEITIPGKASPHAVSNWINTAKCLELALNNGADIRTGLQVGPMTGLLEEFQTIDEVWSAYQQQFEHFARLAVLGSNTADIAHRHQYRLPYLSLLTDDCVTNGRDIIEGGARYNYHSSAVLGMPNVADSLAAVQQAVFEQKLIGKQQLVDMLKNNYEGDETLRQMLLHKMPKYGNDIELPDHFAAEVSRHACEFLGGCKTVDGGSYFVHLFSFVMMLNLGKLTAATPDGRLCGDPLAYSLSPAQGRDKEGITAALQSLAKIPHRLAAASSSAILDIDPSLLSTIGKTAFASLITAAIEMGVGQMQFNVVDAATLRAAQSNPDRYRNLSVRVSGFSQQFCLLDPEMQEHIIARTKHTR
ncbi:MAG: pyruvate formate lyase family protein [Armatimonadota bacterium]